MTFFQANWNFGLEDIEYQVELTQEGGFRGEVFPLLAIAGGLGVLAALFFLLRALYSRRWEKGLSCSLRFREEYGVEGGVSSLTEVLANDKGLPLPVVEIDFHIDRRLRFTGGGNYALSDQSYRRDVFTLAARERVTRTLEFRCTERGYFRIEEAGVAARDLFLTQKYLGSFPQHTEFYVLPKGVPVGQVAPPFSRIMGEMVSRKKIYDDPFAFAGLRDYARGDPMKYINWKATARAGKMLTNLHESTLSQRVVLLLDMEGAADPLNEASVRLCCALCQRLLEEGVSLAAYSNGTDAATGARWELEGLQGGGSQLYLKKRFACIQAGDGLEDVCRLLPEQPGKEDLVVLLSYRQRPELAEDFAQAVGPGRGVQVIPCRGERRELPAHKNVSLVWTEVIVRLCRSGRRVSREGQDVIERLGIETREGLPASPGQRQPLLDLSPSGVIRRRYRKVVRRAKKEAPKPWQTPGEIEADRKLQVPGLHRLYEKARYSTQPCTREDVRALKQGERSPGPDC